MPLIILGALVLFLVFVLSQWIEKNVPNPRRLRFALIAFLVAAAVLLFFAARFPLAALLMLSAFVIWVRPRLNQQEARPGLASMPTGPMIRSSLLRLYLAPAAGGLEGEVLRGPQSGSYLSQLDRDGLSHLLAQAQAEDAESAAALDAYMQFQYGEAWTSEVSDVPNIALDESEARAILGVGDAASPEEIRAAHRTLVRRFHPDHGGPSYFTLRINQAKDRLLQG